MRSVTILVASFCLWTLGFIQEGEARRRGRRVGHYRLTFYLIYPEHHFRGKREVTLIRRVSAGEFRKLPGKYTRKFAKSIQLQGSGTLRNGRIVQYVETCFPLSRKSAKKLRAEQHKRNWKEHHKLRKYLRKGKKKKKRRRKKRKRRRRSQLLDPTVNPWLRKMCRRRRGRHGKRRKHGRHGKHGKRRRHGRRRMAAHSRFTRYFLLSRRKRRRIAIRGFCYIVRYGPKRHRWGTGVSGASLRPLRSLAVDPKRIRLGSTVLIPQLGRYFRKKGLRHNGCFRAQDSGGYIQKARLDLFVGSLGIRRTYVGTAFPHFVKVYVNHPRCRRRGAFRALGIRIKRSRRRARRGRKRHRSRRRRGRKRRRR